MKKLAVVMVAMMIVGMAATAMAADTNTLTVSATVQGACKFVSTTSTLAFGALDPSVGTNVNGTGTTQFWCTKGVTESITADNGLNFAASRQMKDPVSTDVIPYSLTLTPDGNPNSGPTSPRTLTIAGTVLGTDYITKTAGSYSDTVMLTITP